MTDRKITALPVVTALTDDDFLVMVDAPGGTAVTKKITVASALAGVRIPQPTSANSTGNITLTTASQDVPGASITVSPTRQEWWLAFGSFDIDITAADAGTIARGIIRLNGGGLGILTKRLAAVDRLTLMVSAATVVAAGTHTVKLTGDLIVGTGGMITFLNTHSRITLLRLPAW